MSLERGLSEFLGQWKDLSSLFITLVGLTFWSSLTCFRNVSPPDHSSPVSFRLIIRRDLCWRWAACPGLIQSSLQILSIWIDGLGLGILRVMDPLKKDFHSRLEIRVFSLNRWAESFQGNIRFWRLRSSGSTWPSKAPNLIPPIRSHFVEGGIADVFRRCVRG